MNVLLKIIKLPELSLRLSIFYELFFLAVLFGGQIFFKNLGDKVFYSCALVAVFLSFVIVLCKSERERVESVQALINEERSSVGREANEVQADSQVIDFCSQECNYCLESQILEDVICSTVRAGIIIAEPVNNRIVDINRFGLEVLQRDREEVVGRTLHEFFKPCSMCESVCDREELENGIWSQCLESVDVDSLHIMLTVSTFESNGRTYLLETFLDVSELESTRRSLREAKEEAEHSNRAKSSFLASMSHEIRTPINAIIGMSELLQRTGVSPEQRRYIDIARTCSENMLALLSDVLDFSKIEAGKLELVNEFFNLTEVLGRTVETVGLKAHQKALEVALIVDPDVPTVLKGDSNRLQQILSNLMNNSCKFTEAGEVVLDVLPGNEKGSSHSEILFKVRDSGNGIPEEKIGDIFESYNQAASGHGSVGGYGLGLAICKQLALMMGGDISVSNLTSGGAEFVFRAAFECGVMNSDNYMPDISDMKILVATQHNDIKRGIGTVIEKYNAAPIYADEATGILATLENDDEITIAFIDSSVALATGSLFDRMQEVSPDIAVILMLCSTEVAINTEGMRHGIIKSILVKPAHEGNIADALGAVLLREVHEEMDALENCGMEKTFKPGTRILLAEDNYYNRILVSGLLKGTGLELVEAVNGVEALNLFKSSKFDLVLMDVRMPVMDGITAVGKMRDWESVSGGVKTPVIAFTANVLTEDIEGYLDAGFDSCLPKPATWSRIMETLKKNLNNDRHGTKADSHVIESRIAGMRDEYRTYVLNEADRILSVLIPAEDWEAVFSVAHDWKGTGAGYGFNLVEKAGTEICSLIRKGKPAGVEAIVRQVIAM